MKKKIMVADDDSAIVDALTLILEDAGYEVISETNGKTVPTIFAQKPDLVLLDIWMSGVNGRDICIKLKRNDKTKNIPVIMISANRDTEQIAKEAGANDFIAKPFQMDSLLNKVKAFV
jgi:DNA-binding response OmpR family regulator